MIRDAAMERVKGKGKKGTKRAEDVNVNKEA
jgi:hypothetical protein